MAKIAKSVSAIKTKTASQVTRSLTPNLNKSNRAVVPMIQEYLLKDKTPGTKLGDYTLGLMKLS